MVWLAISGTGIIGPFCFYYSRRQYITVNTERYIAMLEEFLVPEIENSKLQNSRICCQKVRATSETDPKQTDFEKGRYSMVPWSQDLPPIFCGDTSNTNSTAIIQETLISSRRTSVANLLPNITSERLQ